MVIEEIQERNRFKLCDPKFESPINLSTRFARLVEMPPIKLMNFQDVKPIRICNTGTSVRVNFPNLCHCKRPKLSGAGFVKNHTLESIQFHWPSEHTIDMERGDLEAQFMFYSDKYKSFEEALKEPLGITVLAILFKKTLYARGNHFQNIANAVRLVSNKPGRSVLSEQGLNLYNFLPYDNHLFFRYQGSLTGPDYKDFVNWIVLKRNSNISYVDYEKLTDICNHKGKAIESNNRNLQYLYDRRVTLQYEPSP